MQFELLLDPDVLPDIRLQLDQQLLVALGLLVQFDGLVLARGVLGVVQGGLRALVRHELIPHLFEQFALLRLPLVTLKSFFLHLHLCFAKFLLGRPVSLEDLKLFNTHVHQDLNGLLYVVNNIESIHLKQLGPLFLHGLVCHLSDFVLGPYLDIQIEFNNCLSHNLG